MSVYIFTRVENSQKYTTTLLQMIASNVLESIFCIMLGYISIKKLYTVFNYELSKNTNRLDVTPLLKVLKSSWSCSLLAYF